MHYRQILASILIISSCPAAALATSSVVNDPLKPQTAKFDQTTTAPTRAGAPSGASNSGGAPAKSQSDQRYFKIYAGVSQEYKLGPGDVLSVTDMGEDKPTIALAPILPDGTTVTSYTGVIQASGMSLREINDYVNEQAKKWYVSPHLVVNLAKQRPTQVYLLGELVHPGLYSTGGDEGGMPTESASGGGESEATGSSGGGTGLSGSGQKTLTISGALQLAGGVKDTADVRHIRVTRLAPKSTFQVDLWKLMLDGDVTEDILLQPGDVVYVPKGGSDFNANDFGRLVNNTPKIRVLGAVKAPGLITMAPDDDLISVLAKAGGFDNVAVTKFVILARTNHDGTVTTEKVNIKKGMFDGHAQAREKIRPGDVVFVKTSPSKVTAHSAGRILPNIVTSALLSIFVSRLNN